MPHERKPEILSGRLRQLLFSPKGGIEGLLLSVKSKTVQVSIKKKEAEATSLQQAIGKPIELKASPDHSPKTRHGDSRHGHPNGVILQSGEFIHTRPTGMQKLKLKVGSKVTAHGELRMTMLGTSLLEASEVNQVPIE